MIESSQHHNVDDTKEPIDVEASIAKMDEITRKWLPTLAQRALEEAKTPEEIAEINDHIRFFREIGVLREII